MPFENPKIESVKELDERTIERIESAPVVGIDGKVGLLLLKTKDKPVSDIEVRGEAWNDGEGRKVVSEDDIAKVEELIRDLGLVFKKEKPTEMRWSSVGNSEEDIIFENITIHVGKDEESLKKILSAKTSQEYGEAYGYPQTAVELFNRGPDDDGNTLMRWELPEEEMKSDYYPFIMFRMSKANWREEVETAKKWAQAVKRNSPKLFQEYSDFIRETDSFY